MKRTIALALLAASVAISGCARSTELVKTANVSTRTDVFQELPDGSPMPQGYADLRIATSLKTHKPGIYAFEKNFHGTPEYRLLINIDGQAMHVQGELSAEKIEPTLLRDPEAGEGIRYRFGKHLRLKAGSHRIVIALPGDEIAVEREIALVEGSVNSLLLEPLYGATAGKQRPGFYGVTSFYEGIKGFRVVLNGRLLQEE